MVASRTGDRAITRRRLLGSVGVAVGLSGCTTLEGLIGEGAAGDVTTVRFWTLFSGGDGEAMASIVDRFNEEQPVEDVRIERQRIPWGEYYTKLYTALVADKGPDIAIMHQALMGRFQRMLDPFDAHLDESTADLYVPTLWERMRFDGEQLALPLDAHPVGMYYNQALFEEAGLDPQSPPTNFEEFAAVCDTIVDETDAHAFAPSLDPIGLLRTFIAMTYQRGGTLLGDDETEVAFDDEAGIGAAQFFRDITGTHEWDIPNASDQRADVAFRDGNLAITMNGTWYAAVLQTVDGFDWNGFKPFVAPDKQQNYTEAGSHTIVLPRNTNRSTQKTRVAVRAAEWLTQENPTWGAEAGHLPAATSALDSQLLRDSPLWPKSLSKYSEMANDDQFAYLPRAPFNVNEPTTWDFLSDIYSHNVSPEEGIERGANDVRGLIENVD